MATFRGPGVLIYKDKRYEPNDNVPMTKEEVAHHRTHAGLLFDDDIEEHSGNLNPRGVGSMPGEGDLPDSETADKDRKK